MRPSARPRAGPGESAARGGGGLRESGGGERATAGRHPLSGRASGLPGESATVVPKRVRADSGFVQTKIIAQAELRPPAPQPQTVEMQRLSRKLAEAQAQIRDLSLRLSKSSSQQW